MAKLYIDAAVEGAKDALATADGAALTLTNSVRVLYDDTVAPGELAVIMDRIRDRILELEG